MVAERNYLRAILWNLVVSFSMVTSTAKAGFVSSNGDSASVGAVCQLGWSQGVSHELQVKFSDGGYVTRIVAVLEGKNIVVRVLSEPMQCEAPRYRDEPTIENRCRSIRTESSDVLVMTPYQDELHILLKSRLLKTKRFWSFKRSDCSIELTRNIFPHP